MRNSPSVTVAIRFSVVLTFLLLGCEKHSFKGFAEFRRSPEEVRQSEIRKVLNHSKIDRNKATEGEIGRLLAKDEITAILDKQMPLGGFKARFDRVVPLVYRSFHPVDSAKNIQDIQWFLSQYGLEATESFIAECERIGVNATLPRIAVAEFKKAQEEEKQRRFEATWGPFAAWSTRSSNAQSLNDIRTVFNGESELAKLRTSHKKEKASNDRRVRKSYIVHEPIYPQVSGVFEFVKELDRSRSEELFSAADGLFVLRLSEGDSFQAYPGRGIRMTMHNRGEKMSMTNGMTLPVFLSGASPWEPKEIPGYEPDRSEENRLEQRCFEVENALTRIRQNIKEVDSGRSTLEEAKPVQLVFERKGSVPQGVIIRDTDSGRNMYYASVKGGNCPPNCEEVPLNSMLKNTGVD